MPPQRLPIVDSDDGVWGDILRQYLMKEHVNDDNDDPANGGHKTITVVAGTTSAGTAPIKLTSGSLMTSPEVGAIEFLTDDLYFTRSTGTTRDAFVFATRSQTLTNKTLTTPVISSISNSGTVTIPTGTHTLVGRATTDTLTNKTFDANGTGNSITNLEVADFAGSAIVTESEGIASNDNDTTLPTSAAVKDYADTQVANRQARFMTGTIATAAATAAKTVTLDSPWASITPAAGDFFLLHYTLGSAVSSSTISINGDTARAVRTTSGQTSSGHISIEANAAVLFHFDGTYMRTVGVPTNTAYSAISQAEITNTGSTTSRLMTGQRAEDLMINEASVARTLTNKTISGSNNTITDLSASSITSGTLPRTAIGIQDFTNLAAGSDFEGATHPWNAGTNWTVQSDQAHSGTYSYRHVTGSGGSSSLQGTFQVQEGERIQIELWARRDSAYNGTDGNSKLRVANAADNSHLNSVSFGTGTVTVADTWTRRTGTITIPAGVTAATFTLQDDGNTGTIWIDDIVIRRVNPIWDSNFILQDETDNTKQLQLQLSGITTATTRTLTVPDASTTIVGTDTAQTLTNKTLTAPTLGGTSIIPQTGTLELYNTTDQVTNYEKSVYRYTSNILELGHIYGGTGQSRAVRFGTGAAAGVLNRYIQIQGSTPFVSYQWSGTTLTGQAINIGSGNTFTASSGNQTALGIDPTINQTSTAGYTGLLINPTESGTGSGTKRLIDAQVGGAARFSVDNAGNTTVLGTLDLGNASDTTLSRSSAGVLAVEGVVVPTVSSVSTLTNKTLTTPVLNGTPTGTGVATAATASTLALRDANANLTANAYNSGFTSTATAAGTTTLTIASTGIQEFTGSTTQTVRLPTTSVVAGATYTIINNSSGVVTVQSSGANTISTMSGGTTARFTALVATPTTAANWDSDYVTGGSTNFIDNVLTLQDSGDNTKQARLDVPTGQTASTTRTHILPATDSTLVGETQAQTLTNKTLTTPVLNGTPTGTGVATAATASTLALRDSSANLTSDNFIASSTSTVTAAGTLTLDINSTQVQVFTGTTTHTVRLPTTSVGIGQSYTIVNNSTGAVAVQSSNGNAITSLAADTVGIFVSRVATPTSNTQWIGNVRLAGDVLTVNSSLTLNGTDGTTMTFPSTNATIARTDAAQTFTGVQTLSSAPVLSTGTVTVGGNTVTVPAATDTLVNLSSAQSITNKTISGSSNTITDLSASSITSGTLPRTAIGVQDFTNLAAGSDFETGAHPWTLGTGWAVASDQFYTGAQSLKSTSTSGTQSSQLQGTFEAKEGDKIYIEFWVRVDAAYNGSDAKMRIAYPNGNGTHITSISYAASGLTDDTWTKRSGTVTIPAGVNQFGVRVQSDQTAGSVWIDDIIIRRVHPYLDSNFTLQNNSDQTKQLQFQLSGLTTATTRTLTVPDANTTIVGTDVSQTLTNKTLTTPRISQINDSNGNAILNLTAVASAVNNITLFNGAAGQSPAFYATGSDANLNIIMVPKGTGRLMVRDGTDNSKIVGLNIATLSTGQTRTWSFPDVSSTFVGTDAAQTLTNKTISGAFNSSGAIFSSSSLTQSDRVTLNFGTTPLIASTQFMDTGAQGSSFANVRFSATANGPYQILAKSRGATIGARAIVLQSDQLGSIAFNGDDGTDFIEGARIRAVVDGTPGAGDMPTRLEFMTTPDGSNQATLALTIKPDNSIATTGNIELGHSSDTTLSRVSAGRIAVEGVNVPTISSADTLTNKTISGSNNTLSNIPSSAVTGMAQMYQSLGNMIIDPSFENDASWTNAWGAQSTDAARHGTKSRRLTATGAGRTTDRIILTHDGSGNPITFPTAGDDMRYWVFAHLRKHAGNTGGGTIYVTARYIDTSGVEQELHASAVTADSLSSSGWNRHWAHAELGTDGREVFASIEIGNDVPSGDQFYIDQVAFKDVSAINLGSTTGQTLENKTMSGDDNTFTDIYPESLDSATDLMGSEMVLGGDFQVDAFWVNAFGAQSTDQSLISGGKSRMITSTGGGATVDRLALLHDGSGANLGQWANQPRSHTWRVTIRKHAGNTGGGNILLRTRWVDYAGSSFTTTTTYAHTSISNSGFSNLVTTHSTTNSYRYFYCYVEMDAIPSGDIYYVGSASLVDNSGSVTPSATQTLSNKTLTNYTEELFAIGTVTTTYTFDLADGNVQTATLTASTACTFTMPTATAGKSFTLFLKQAAVTGNGSATFSGVRWNAAGAPTITATAGKMDILNFAADGTNWYGSYTQGYTP